MYYALAALAAGYLTKAADDYSERVQKRIIVSLSLGIVYPVAIIAGGLIEPAVFPLIAGAVVGNIFSGKIDAIEHVLASIIILGSVLALGYSVDAIVLVAFTVSSFLDEGLHGLGGRSGRKMRALLQARLATPLVALLLAPFSISYLIYILAFDLGYRIKGRAVPAKQ